MKVNLDNEVYKTCVQKDAVLLYDDNVDEKKSFEDEGITQNGTIACVYKPYGGVDTEFGTYNKAIVQANALRAVTTNKQIQQNLRDLGFYDGNIALDGNLSSEESKRAIKNFQKVYGVSDTGNWNTETSNKLASAIKVYNDTYNSAGSSTLARIKSGYSDYNEDLLKKNISKIWAFLKVGMGTDNVHASAVMGNIIEESGASSICVRDGNDALFNNTYKYDSYDGKAYGILQWKFWSRKAGLESTASDMGLSTGDINAQLAFFRKESQGDYRTAWNSFLNTGTVDSATDVFRNEFEQTSDGESLRKEAANKAYAALC